MKKILRAQNEAEFISAMNEFEEIETFTRVHPRLEVEILKNWLADAPVYWDRKIKEAKVFYKTEASYSGCGVRFLTPIIRVEAPHSGNIYQTRGEYKQINNFSGDRCNAPTKKINERIIF